MTDETERSDDAELPPPKGSGENPDVGGIDVGPGEPDRGTDGSQGSRADSGTVPPAPDGERSARDVGGPTSSDDAEPDSGTVADGGKGDIRTKGFDAHS